MEAVSPTIEKCMGKNIYPAEDIAYAASKIAEDRTGYPLRIYKCPYGNHWHLTSKNVW